MNNVNKNKQQEGNTMNNLNIKNIATMSQQEIEQLGRLDKGALFELVRAFFLTDKEVTRSIVVAMIVLRQTDFGCLSLRNLDLSGLDLQGVNFEGSEIEGCDFSHADLSNATFEYARIQECNFERALMINTFMFSGKFKRCDFDCVNLIYSLRLPDDFTEQNQNTNTGMPQWCLAINGDNDVDVRLALKCLVTLLDAFVEQGVDAKNTLVLASMVYPYLKIKVDGDMHQEAFFEFFDQHYPIWLMKKVSVFNTENIEPLSGSGLEAFF